MNPYNGIESSIPGSSQDKKIESIQWNWKMSVAEAVDLLKAVNPYNGIERFYLPVLPPLHIPLWIHTMELKDEFPLHHTPPPPGESIQWNWKPYPATAISSVFNCESIQWNWKLNVQPLWIDHEQVLNPYNGIERRPSRPTRSPSSWAWIHTMELKAWLALDSF